MPTIGYVRVSTEDQAKEGVSLDNQRSKIEAYCQCKRIAKPSSLQVST
jgi:DNA invertase Pin-like site-specific DNA recombinase